MKISTGIIDEFIIFILNHQGTNDWTESRSKLPCTYCSITKSPTWRPGPCGPSTLCNKCGVLYMNSGNRTRNIDLLCKQGKPVWYRRNPTTWDWKAEKEISMDDPRVSAWYHREMRRNNMWLEENKAKKQRTTLSV